MRVCLSPHRIRLRARGAGRRRRFDPAVHKPEPPRRHLPDPAADWHTYAASIEPSGTVWYVDRVEVCRTEATSDAMTNIVSNLAVHAKEPPAAQTTAAVNEWTTCGHGTASRDSATRSLSAPNAVRRGLTGRGRC